MNVIVMGAGVVGVTTAYYLGAAGCRVTLVDRCSGAADETSYGNAGLVSPGDATAWASPAALRTFVQSLFRSDMGIKVRPSLDPRFLGWTLKFLTQCTHAKARANTLRKLRLALYARENINALSEATGVHYDERRSGIVYFYRSAASLDGAASHVRFMVEHGLQAQVLDREALAAVEPGLAGVRHELAGGVHVRTDQTGDSRLFSRRLLDWCREHQGLDARLGTRIERLRAEGGRIAGVDTDRGRLQADLYVLATGCDSPMLAATVGVTVPVYPVKGYSMTVPIAPGETGPTMGGVDDDRLVAYSRLGERLRIASTAEFAGWDRSHRPEDFHLAIRAGRALFPTIAALQRAQAAADDPIDYWAGLRPMTPSSVPMIGPARYPNLLLNTGHGHVGWTLACGSGKLVADLALGRSPEIDTEGLLYAPGRL